MESNGWQFSWNDNYVFRPNLVTEGLTVCGDVSPKSYYGFQSPGDGEISYTFSDSGTAMLSYGQGMDINPGSVHVYMNNEKLDSGEMCRYSNLNISYSPGDVLQIKEINDNIIVIHSLCTLAVDSPGTYLKIQFIIIINV